MAKASGDEKSSADGLEIISIGKMYSGQWDKKYWSSSRGKDRYPYPIGYNAVRTRNGVTYKMEILEGRKGPLFMISSTDGKSCSGQTPDIAWECFQKKSSSQIKFWHGKRFSCKIDGVEFFGFRNAFVQRLLRELVANVSGTVEQGCPLSSFCNGATETGNQPQPAESIMCTDLPPHLEKPRVTGKRSRKHKIINFKSVDMDVVQKLPQNGNHNSDAARCMESSAAFCASDENYGSCGSPRAPVNLEDVLFKESRQTLSERDSKLNFPDFSGSHKVNDLLLQEPTRLSWSKSLEAVEEDGSFPKEELGTQRLSDNIAEEILISDTLQTVNDANIFAPDTFDPSPDESFDSATKIPPEVEHVKENTMATDLVMSEVLVTESHPEDDAGSCVPKCSSQTSETDLFGQEIAKSMMTVLLPRALPLLKKTFSRRKKKNVRSLKDFQSDEGNNNNADCENVASTATEHMEKSPLENQKENMQPPNSHAVLPNFSHMDSVVPDSLDNDEPGRCLSNPLAQYSGDAEVDPTHLSGEPGMAEMSRPAVSVNTEAGAPVCHTGPIDCRMGLCSGRQIALNRGTREGDSSKCISHLGCRSSHREDNCLKSSGISLCGNIHSRLENFETLPDNTGDIITTANLVEAKKSLCVPSQESNLDTKGSELPASRTPDVATGSSIMCTSLMEGELHGDSKDTCGSKIDAKLQNLASSKFSEVSSFCQIPSRNCLPSNVTREALDRDLAVDNSRSSFDHRVCNMTKNNEVKERSYSKAQAFPEHTKLLASYVHPGPISMVLLRIKENEIYICILCGILGHEEKMLFLYKAPMEEENMGCPSFIGHVSLILPSVKDAFGRDVALEKSGLQFTPDAESLVLLNCIRTPCCRKGDVHCPCGSCKADHCEKNAVKIVEVKDGFISVSTKLKTCKSVCCLLVCEPSFLIAAEESGKLYLWLMNPNWSAKTEEFYLPAPEIVPPCSMELKKIPKSMALVVGHNGLGEFCLWDIYKRTLVSKFSAPGTSIYQFIPVSCFRWQQKGMDTNVEECINEIMHLTEKWFSEMNENHGAFPAVAEDVAIWLLTSSDRDPQCGHSDSVMCWRLGLLTKNMMIMGSVMDPRAVVVGASADHGIIGRDDGLLYIWELSTGVNLGSFHHFRGERPSCIATEDSGSGAFAIATDGGQLRIYLQS